MIEDEPLLIRRLRKGDSKAWDEFVTDHREALLAFAGRYLRDPVAREDVVQETFISFYNSLPTFYCRGEPSDFLVTIARVKIDDFLERQRRQTAPPDNEGELLPPPRERRLAHSDAAGLHDVIDRRIAGAQLDQSDVYGDLVRVKALIETDPDMALAKCRQLLERTLHRVHSATVGNPGTKRLEELISGLNRQGKIPRKVYALCEAVRELGNVGTHPIYDDEKLSHRESQIALFSLIIVLEWTHRSGVGQARSAPSVAEMSRAEGSDQQRQDQEEK